MAAWGVIEWLRFGGRSNGPFLDLNAFGALFYLAVPPAFIALAQVHSRRARAALAAFIALCLLALFATVSRGAIGILLLLLAPLILGLRRSGAPWRAPAAILLVLVGFAYGTVRYLPENPVTRAVVNLSADQSTQDRLAMWRSALDIWRERPVTGMGLGSYKLHYLHYRSPEERSSTRRSGPQRLSANPGRRRPASAGALDPGGSGHADPGRAALAPAGSNLCPR